MLRKMELLHGRSIDIIYDEKVFNPARTSIDPIVIADMFLIPGMKVLDVGTGSGYLALALKKLNPEVEIHATDLYPDAVKQAKANAKGLGLDIKVTKNNLAKGMQGFDMVIANLPTFNEEDMEQNQLFGPKGAYYADSEDNLKLYRQLFEQLSYVLWQEGLFVCELRKDMHERMRKLAAEHDWIQIMETDQALAFART